MNQMNEAVRAATPETASETYQHRKFSAKSADRKAQQQRILAALRLRPHTTMELRRAPVGSFQCPTRIFELRKQGYVIDTTLVTVIDEDSFAHPRTAMYSLVSEPEAA